MGFNLRKAKRIQKHKLDAEKNLELYRMLNDEYSAYRFNKYIERSERDLVDAVVKELGLKKLPDELEYPQLLTTLAQDFVDHPTVIASSNFSSYYMSVTNSYILDLENSFRLYLKYSSKYRSYRD